MGFGPVTFATAQSVDEVAPGSPAFNSVTQPPGQDEKYTCSLTLPTTDSDGTPLTGLTKLAVFTTIKEGDVNPYEGLSMDQIIALNNEQNGVIMTLDPAVNTPGSVVEVELPIILLGSTQQFAAACSDEA
jgi:hypothetical protein